MLARRTAAASPPAIEQSLKRLQPVGIARVLVPAQPADAREAHRDAGFVAGRTLEAPQRPFEHQAAGGGMHDFADRTKTAHRVVAHEFIDLAELPLRETQIGPCDRDNMRS